MSDVANSCRCIYDGIRLCYELSWRQLRGKHLLATASWQAQHSLRLRASSAATLTTHLQVYACSVRVAYAIGDGDRHAAVDAAGQVAHVYGVTGPGPRGDHVAGLVAAELDGRPAGAGDGVYVRTAPAVQAHRSRSIERHVQASSRGDKRGAGNVSINTQRRRHLWPVGVGGRCTVSDMACPPPPTPCMEALHTWQATRGSFPYAAARGSSCCQTGGAYTLRTQSPKADLPSGCRCTCWCMSKHLSWHSCRCSWHQTACCAH